MKTRDLYFDNIKFLLICLVIVGHTIEPLLNSGKALKALYMWIYSFHMPLFIFISGYFSKSVKPVGNFGKVLRSIIVPYLVFEVLYSLFDFWVFERESLTFSFLTPYWLMWFLFSLAVWKLFLPYVVKVRYVMAISVLFAVLAGYMNDIGYRMSLSRTIVFFPFFLAGYYSERRYLEKLYRPIWRSTAWGVLVASFLVFFYLGQGLDVQWFYGSYSYAALGHKEWYAGFYRMGLYAVAAVSSLAVLLICPQGKIPLISRMGQNTLYAYLLHGFVIKYLISAGVYNHFYTGCRKGLLILIGISLAVLLSTGCIRYLFRRIVEPI